MHRLTVVYSIAVVALALIVPSGDASAFPGFGEMINTFCTAEQRTPPAPFDGSCTTCHMSGTSKDPSNRVQPTWDEFENARKGQNGVPQGDFSFFCELIVVANQVPIIDPIPDLMVNVGDTLTLPITATDPDMDPIQLSVSSNDAMGFGFVDFAAGQGELTWTPMIAGNFGFRVSATDGIGTSSQDVVVTVGNVNLPPVLDPIGDQLASSGVPTRFFITAFDDDGDKLTFEMSGAPATASLVVVDPLTVEFEWTPGIGEVGNFPILFSVTDDGVPMESDSEEIMISVGGANRPPMLGAIGNRSVRPGETLQFPLTATDPEGDLLTFEASGLPFGAMITEHPDGSVGFSWTPMIDQIGSYDVEFSVTDSGTPPESDLELVTLSVLDGTVGPQELMVKRAVWKPKHKKEKRRDQEDRDDDDDDGDDDDRDKDEDHRGDDDGDDEDDDEREHSRVSDGGELRVNGRYTLTDALVEIWDADRGELIGETRTRKKGKFRLKLRMSSPPCRVEARVDGFESNVVDVRKAGEVCRR